MSWLLYVLGVVALVGGVAGVVLPMLPGSLLLFGGAQISKHKPPIPARVVTPAGEVVSGAEVIGLGQRAYLSRGGQSTGSVWGHGSYLAPDWSADALQNPPPVTSPIGTISVTARAARCAPVAVWAIRSVDHRARR